MAKKTVVAVALIVTLLFNAVRPSRAAAVETGVLVIGSIAAFVAFIIVGTLLTTHRTVPAFLQEPPPQDFDASAPTSPKGVHFSGHCHRTPEGVQPLVCW